MLFVICCLLLLCFMGSQSATFKSVELTSLSNAQDGISVTEMYGIIATNFDEWLMNSTASSSNWNLLIELDESWAFDAQSWLSSNSLSVTLHGFAVTDDVELELAFNVHGDYLSTGIYLSNQQNNEISPSCSQIATSISNAPAMNSGNISKLPSHRYTAWMPTQYSTKQGALKGYDNDFPLTFTISQIANNLTKISYSSASWDGFEQYCLFSPFDTDSALQIYIASNGNGQQLAISSIYIESTNNLANFTSTFSKQAPYTTETIAVSAQQRDNGTFNLNVLHLLLNALVTLTTMCCFCLAASIAWYVIRKHFSCEHEPTVQQKQSGASLHITSTPRPTTDTPPGCTTTPPYSAHHEPPSNANMDKICATNMDANACTHGLPETVQREYTEDGSIESEPKPTSDFDGNEQHSNPSDPEALMELTEEKNFDKSMNRMLSIPTLHSFNTSFRPSPENSDNASYDDVCVAMVSLDDLQAMIEGHEFPLHLREHGQYSAQSTPTVGSERSERTQLVAPWSFTPPLHGIAPTIDFHKSAPDEKSESVIPSLPENESIYL